MWYKPVSRQEVELWSHSLHRHVIIANLSSSHPQFSELLRIILSHAQKSSQKKKCLFIFEIHWLLLTIVADISLCVNCSRICAKFFKFIISFNFTSLRNRLSNFISLVLQMRFQRDYIIPQDDLGRGKPGFHLIPKCMLFTILFFLPQSCYIDSLQQKT